LESQESSRPAVSGVTRFHLLPAQIPLHFRQIVHFDPSVCLTCSRINCQLESPRKDCVIWSCLPENKGRFLIKADLYQISVRYWDTTHAEVAKRTLRSGSEGLSLRLGCFMRIGRSTACCDCACMCLVINALISFLTLRAFTMKNMVILPLGYAKFYFRVPLTPGGLPSN
jgi:hypothetical protein